MFFKHNAAQITGTSNISEKKPKTLLTLQNECDVETFNIWFNSYTERTRHRFNSELSTWETKRSLD